MKKPQERVLSMPLSILCTSRKLMTARRSCHLEEKVCQNVCIGPGSTNLNCLSDQTSVSPRSHNTPCFMVGISNSQPQEIFFSSADLELLNREKAKNFACKLRLMLPRSYSTYRLA